MRTIHRSISALFGKGIITAGVVADFTITNKDTKMARIKIEEQSKHSCECFVCKFYHPT